MEAAVAASGAIIISVMPLPFLPLRSASHTWYSALRCRCRSRISFRSRFRNRFRKSRVRTCRSICRCWGVCAAGPEAGRRVSRAKEWAELQAGTNGRYGKNRIRSYMNGSTATANLRKRRTLFFYVSYGVLTEFLRTNVILIRAFATDNGDTETEERIRDGGNQP